MAHDTAIGTATEDAARRVLDPNFSKRNRLQRRCAVMFALAIATAGLAYAAYSTDNNLPRFDSTVVKRADLIATVVATGTVEAKSKVEVGAELSGLIKQVNVDFNARVTRGQVLAVLDTGEYQAQVVQNKADLQAAVASRLEATATLKETEGKLQRARILARKGWATVQAEETAQATYDRAVGELQAADARVSVAAARLDGSETKLGKTQILAPMNGTVIDRLVEPGQVVVAALQTPHLFTIVGNLEEMKLTTAVSEADIAGVAPGQPVQFTVDAYPQRAFSGVVSEIRNMPRNVNGVVTYSVIVSVLNQNLLLKPGMTATIDIITVHDKGVLTVPNAALRFTPPGQAPFRPEPAADGIRRGQLWLSDDNGRLKLIQVQLGPSDGRMTEVREGVIAEGEVVLTAVQMEPTS
jgi:HlyD family secretion protein